MRTTIGQILVNEALPSNLRDYSRRLDKKTMNQVLAQVAEEQPEHYPDTVFKWKTLGDEVSFLQGSSFSLDDLSPVVDKKKEFDRVERQALGLKMQTGLSKAERDQRIAGLYQDLNKKLTEQTMKASLQRGSGLAQMVAAGARGKAGQLSQIVTAPVMFSDHKQQPILMPIKSSFSEGLSPSEYWASAYGTRRGVISTKFATADAGAFAKQLAQAAVPLVVTERDCGTSNGIPSTPEDRDNVGAYLATPAGGYSAGTLITPEVLAELKKRRVTRIVVRSPTTCESRKGICAKCRGIDELNRLPDVGKNLGVAAAQAMGEPVSQMSLNVRHSGGVAGVGGIASGYQLLNQLASIPKEFPNKAALAGQTGRVTRIESAPQGGTFIYVGDQKHYTLPNMKPIVRVGQKIEEGDPLDNGVVNPAEVVQHKGVGAGRLHMVNALRNAYDDAGAGVHRRHLEVMSRALINQAQVDTGDVADGALPDDLVDFQHLQKTYKPKASRVEPLKSAAGKFLVKPVLHYTTGTKLLPSMVKQLEKFGVKQVTVEDEAPPFRPMMLRMQDAPHVGTDWMTQLYSRNLKRQLLKAVHRGKDAPVHGPSFIPSLAHSPTFGKSPRGPAEY